MTRVRSLPSTLLVPLAGLATLSPALADDAKGGKDALPGVDLEYRLVKPAPEPGTLPDGLVADKDGFVTIGNTRVKVSGLIRYQVDYVGKNRKR